MKNSAPIGFLDSGIGGSTVLIKSLSVLPNENYVFFSDSANCPYGDKSDGEIIERCDKIVSFLIKNYGCKAIVIACNTASAKASAYLREKYSLPIIAIEPAYKMVYDQNPDGFTLVMATKGTLESEKFHKLYYKYNNHKTALIACVGLADIIEHGTKSELCDYLDKTLDEYKGKAQNVVLGCTHYPLAKKEIKNTLGDVEFFDGANGVSRQLKRVLEEKDLISDSKDKGNITFKRGRDMIEKLQEVENRFEEVNELVCNPDIVCDQEKYTKLMRELKHLTPVVEKFREYKKAKASEEESRAMLDEGGMDADFAQMVKEEYEQSREDMERIEEELKVLLLPRDPNDDKNVIIEIRGGAGGEESALFAGVLFRMYSMYAESKGFKTEILNANETGLGGYKEISFSVEGDGAYSRFKFESGVHRVQRVPETESQGRIHTSTTTVAVLPEAEDVDFEINPKDLQIDTFRSSGAGGQHINKTSSAIRITHIPTGTVVECQDERSQHKNKEKALKVLRSRLYDAEKAKHDAEIAGERKAQVGTGDRSERIRTYNYPQGRVSDHRIGLTLYKLEQFLNGDMDEMIDALITADTAEKLKAQGEE